MVYKLDVLCHPLDSFLPEVLLRLIREDWASLVAQTGGLAFLACHRFN